MKGSTARQSSGGSKGVSNPAFLKGDVVWVPYRRDPNWPALVQNVYPKKLTYAFFPLPRGAKRPPTFSVHPKNVYALSIFDKLPPRATDDLREAFGEACDYLRQRGLEVGAVITRRPQIVDGNGDKNRGDVVDQDQVAAGGDEPESSSTSEEPTMQDGGESVRKEEGGDGEMNGVESVLEAAMSGEEQVTSSGVLSPYNMELDTQQDAEIALRDCEIVTARLLANPSMKMQHYITPPRNDLLVTFRNGGLLTDAESDAVVERIVPLVRVKYPELSLVSAVHFCQLFVMPAVLRHALMEARKITADAADDILNGNGPPIHNNHKKTNGFASLEELVRVACREREILDEKS